MYAFRHYISRQNRIIEPAVLGQLLALKTETQRRLTQCADVAIQLTPEAKRLRYWAKVALCELPDGFNGVGGIRRSGIIVPDLIIRTLIKENKIRQQSRRRSCTECSSITRINSPLGHYPQATVFFELLNDECCRLGLSELHCTLMQLSATLMEASERERFALVCFHALLIPY